MWCPAAAAFVSALVTRRSIRAFGWSWPGARFIAGAYALPVAYAAVAYALIWAMGLGRPDTLHYFAVKHRAFWPTLPLIATVGIFGSCLTALGEEIGWRGFLVPVLASRFTLTTTALISGAIWTLWHVPIIVFGDYNNGAPAWYSVTCFTIMVMAVAFVFAWFRLASGSLWPCVMLHAAHNTAVQAIFTPLTANTGHTAWFIDEFGAFLPLTIVITAIILIRAKALQNGRMPERLNLAAMQPKSMRTG